MLWLKWMILPCCGGRLRIATDKVFVTSAAVWVASIDQSNVRIQVNQAVHAATRAAGLSSTPAGADTAQTGCRRLQRQPWSALLCSAR